MWFIYTIGLIFILCFIFYSHRVVQLKTISKFNNLISCLLQLDKDLKLEYENKDNILLFAVNNNGTINIFLVEYNGILNVTIELINNTNNFEKKEWVFMDEMNQFFIYEEILTTFLKESTSPFLDKKKLRKLMYKNVEKTKKIPIKNIFTKDNLTPASFCLAFNSVKFLRPEVCINSKSEFEILLFNCILTYHKIKENSTNYDWQEYLKILINYLENKSLIKQLDDVDLYFNHRYAIFSEEIENIKYNSNPNFSTLYYYFFENPFSTKIKMKIVVGDQIDFVKSLSIVIADIEEKVTRLELLAK